MPFTYQNTSDPRLAGSIAELMARRGDIAAHAAETIGAANARAAEIGGQAWAGAAQNIGQSVAGSIQQATDPRRQLEQVQLGELKKNISEGDTLKSIIKRTPKVDLGNGVMGYDVPTITDAVSQQGGDPSVVASHLTPINDSFQQVYASKVAAIQQGAKSIIAAGNDPTLALDYLDTVEKNHVFPPQQLQHYRDLIAADPGNVAKITAALSGPQKFAPAAPGSGVLNETTGQLVPGQKVPDKPVAVRPGGSLVQPETGAVVATVPQQAPLANPETERHNKEMERIAGLNAGKADAAQKEIERHNRATEAQGEAAPALTPDAIKLTAHQFAMTGQLPPMGMGKTGAKVRTDIINAAADEYKHLDLPSQVAAYKANQASLTKLQGVADKVSAFESTAGKNLDQFLTLADKIPDTGVPWLNTPIRLVNDKMVGSENQAAANAARDVALREIARVTNDPNLTGVISDSARKEVSSLSPQNATFAQIKAVAKVLKQDMANVHSSLTEQIGAVQQRIATPPGSTAPPAPASKSGTIRARDPQGVLHEAPAGTTLPAGWKLEP